MKMLDKIRDFGDTSVSFVILFDDADQLLIMEEVIKSIGKERCSYAVHKNEITAYMMELRLPYNRYLAMMNGLRKRGWNLKAESEEDVINRLIKD